MVLMPILTNGLGVAALTWGTIMLEFCLAVGLVLSRRWWGHLLVAGLALHLLIALFMGLVSFGMAMAGALILFLRPVDRPFTLAWLSRLTTRVRSLGGPHMTGAAAALRFAS
jgi:hypothetical protein